MENEKYLEKANFRALIETDGNEGIQERLTMIDVFLGTEDHVTIEEMCRLLREKGYDFNPQFVKQSMNRMVDLGFAQKKQFEGQPIRYEHRRLGRHHDHLICTKCGHIEEFSDEDMERLQTHIAAERGFHMLQHRMEIYGLCSECLARRRPLMPLLMAKAGEKVVIREMTGGRTVRARLADMGLRPGDHLEIISNTDKGRIILAHDCTRLAMGKGVAKKIMVSLSDSEGDDLCLET
ncbi:MAG: Fur family transcriptional regulator [Deltaproteobacteria bacterium]|nr:Fur family transcriptional regulator [Deltaproteobacteria bacterium]